MNIVKGDGIMKNKWMITFVVVISAIAYFGTLFTADSGARVSDIHNTEYSAHM